MDIAPTPHSQLQLHRIRPPPFLHQSLPLQQPRQPTVLTTRIRTATSTTAHAHRLRAVYILDISAPYARRVLFVYNLPGKRQPIPLHQERGGLRDCICDITVLVLAVVGYRLTETYGAGCSTVLKSSAPTGFSLAHRPVSRLHRQLTLAPCSPRLRITCSSSRILTTGMLMRRTCKRN